MSADKKKGADSYQAAPQQHQSNPKDTTKMVQAHTLRWTHADEREAMKLMMAYHRFRLAGLLERDAVAMVRTWASDKADRTYTGTDFAAHPMHAEIVKRMLARQSKRTEAGND